MKKIFIILMLLCMLSGCGSQEYIEDFNINSETIDETGKKPQEADEAKQKVVDDEFNYMMGGNAYVTGNEEGLYYIATRSKIVRYYNYSGKDDIVWCNKLDCNHDTSRCAAYVLSQNDSQYFLQYHKEHLYMINYQDDGIFMEQYDMDGSNQIRIGNLYPDDTNVANVFNGKFYKDKYYYYVTDTNRNRHYYMIDLKQDSKPIKLFVSEDWGARKLSTFFAVNDDGILYREGKSADEITTLKQYDIKSNQSKVILGNDYQYEAECNDDIYILKDGGVYRIENGELVVVFENEDIQYNNCYMYINGRYIVIDHRNEDGTNYSDKGQRYFYIYDIANERVKKMDLASDCKVYDKDVEDEEKRGLSSTTIKGMCNDYFYYTQLQDGKIRKINLRCFFEGGEEKEYEESLAIKTGKNQ